MSEKPEKNQAMEGREYNANGKDIGDAQFHEVGWDTTPEAAKADLQRMAAAEVGLAEQQAEHFVRHDRATGIKAFKSLLNLYPGHPRVQHWKQRLEELKTNT